MTGDDGMMLGILIAVGIGAALQCVFTIMFDRWLDKHVRRR